MPIRVAIVEDRSEVRQGLAYLISASEGFDCVATFEDAESALAAMAVLEVDVVLLDIGLPGMSGIEVLPHLKKKRPQVQVMMLTVYEDDDRIFQSLQAGATGYVLKKTPPSELLKDIILLNNGGSPMSSQIARRVVETFHKPAVSPEVEKVLTPREQETLELLVQGYRYREIAEELFVSLDTVRTHIRHIYEKLHVRSRTEAAMKYLGRS